MIIRTGNYLVKLKGDTRTVPDERCEVVVSDRTKVILLNGPPGCGKDELATRLLSGNTGAAPQSFKEPLIRLTAELYGIPYLCFGEMCRDRNLKETKSDRLDGKTPREALIHTSEKVVKPSLGATFFGARAANRLTREKVNIFSDSGFDQEVIPLADLVGYGNILLVQILGRGSFSNDSRSYLSTNKHENIITVHNDGTLGEYLSNAEAAIKGYGRGFYG